MRQVFFYITSSYVDACMAFNLNEASLEFSSLGCHEGSCVSLQGIESMGIDDVKRYFGRYLDYLDYSGDRYFLNNSFATVDSIRGTIVAFVEAP